MNRKKFCTHGIASAFTVPEGIARKPFFGAKTAGSQFFCCKYKTRSLPYYSKQGISTGSMTILTRLDDRTNRLSSRTYQIFGKANKGTAGIGGARNALLLARPLRLSKGGPATMEAKAGTPESPPKMPRSSFKQLLDSRKKRRKRLLLPIQVPLKKIKVSTCLINSVQRYE